MLQQVEEFVANERWVLLFNKDVPGVAINVAHRSVNSDLPVMSFELIRISHVVLSYLFTADILFVGVRDTTDNFRVYQLTIS